MPDYKGMREKKSGTLPIFAFVARDRVERYGFEYSGYIRIPETGVYSFFTDSDDGSRLYVGDELIVDNDGLHGPLEKEGVAALQEGYHPIRVEYFQKTGGAQLLVKIEAVNMEKQTLPAKWLYRISSGNAQ